MNFPYPLRFEHCYIPGGTGHGKTTLLENMILTDIKNGAGVTFIDPKGTSVNRLLHHIPEKRKDDCIYLDVDNPTAFDFLSYHGLHEKEELIKDLTFLLLRGISSTAVRADSILGDMVFTLLTADTPTCLLDAYYFLSKRPAPWSHGDQKDGRFFEIIEALPESETKHRWLYDFPKPDELRPIFTRLRPLERNFVSKRLFGTLQPAFNVAHAMNGRKIIFLNVGGASATGMDYASLLLAKMRQEVFRRYRRPRSEYIPHFLFIDEFDKYPNPDTFADMLKMAREFKLSCTLANTSRHDLDPKIQSAIGIISNYIIFSLNPEDLGFFRHIRLPESLEVLDLCNLEQYHALYKLGREIIYKPTPKPIGFSKASSAEYIKNRTIQRYACDTPPVGDTTVDGKDTPPSEGINASGEPSVPPDGGKKKKPQNSR